MDKKFSRSTNFSTREENILLNLVEKYKDHVECKLSDTNTNNIKAKAWVKIAQEYNSNVGEPLRSEKVLKIKYENIKKREKKKYADHKKYISGTGGGPSKEVVVTEIDNDIEEILGFQLTGLESEFDGDSARAVEILISQELADKSKSFSYDFEALEVPLTPKTKNIIEMPSTSTSDSTCQPPSTSASTELNASSWARYTPSMLKRPVSCPLKIAEKGTPVKRRNAQGLGIKLEEWAKSKTMFTEAQEKAINEKHLLAMQQMKEKHEHYIAIQEEESKLRIKNLTEEHKMKMKILEKELSLQ